MKKYISLAFTLGIMLLIFCLSAQPGETSYALSGTVLDIVQGSDAAGIAPELFSANLNANIRKWAHIYIYCALGFSMAVTVCMFVRRSDKTRSLRYYALCTTVSAALCLLYAASDELHQLFVPARAALAADVLLDAVGFVPSAALGCLCVYLVRRLKNKKGK